MAEWLRASTGEGAAVKCSRCCLQQRLHLAATTPADKGWTASWAKHSSGTALQQTAAHPDKLRGQRLHIAAQPARDLRPG